MNFVILALLSSCESLTVSGCLKLDPHDERMDRIFPRGRNPVDHLILKIKVQIFCF